MDKLTYNVTCDRIIKVHFWGTLCTKVDIYKKTMPRIEKHHRQDRSLEDRIILDRSLIRTRPIANIKHELKPQLIAIFKRQYGENLTGEIIETRSGSYYVVRRTVEEGLEASPLGEYRSDRPHIVILPNDASGIVVDRKKIGSRHKTGYKKILLEIREEGGNVEILLEKNSLFGLS